MAVPEVAGFGPARPEALTARNPKTSETSGRLRSVQALASSGLPGPKAKPKAKAKSLNKGDTGQSASGATQGQGGGTGGSSHPSTHAGDRLVETSQALKPTKQKALEARFPETVRLVFTSLSQDQLTVDCPVLGTGKASNPRVTFVAPDSGSSCVKIGTEECHGNEQAVLTMPAPNAGVTSRVYAAMTMERLLPFREEPALVWSSFLAATSMSRFTDIRDFGADNWGLRGVAERSVHQVVMVDSGSWDLPGQFSFPRGWKAGQWWKLFQRVCPEHLELVNQHAKSLAVLFEEITHLMHRALDQAIYKEVMNNMVEQGALTLSPLGRAGFSMPEDRMTEEVNPVSWKLVDLKLPGFPNWWTGQLP